jgi:hypothetical protein
MFYPQEYRFTVCFRGTHAWSIRQAIILCPPFSSADVTGFPRDEWLAAIGIVPRQAEFIWNVRKTLGLQSPPVHSNPSLSSHFLLCFQYSYPKPFPLFPDTCTLFSYPPPPTPTEVSIKLHKEYLNLKHFPLVAAGNLVSILSEGKPHRRQQLWFVPAYWDRKVAILWLAHQPIILSLWRSTWDMLTVFSL